MNKDYCRCTYRGCQRHGNCRECIRYHRDDKEFPACFFSEEGEKTYDRSWENLKKNYRYE